MNEKGKQVRSNEIVTRGGKENKHKIEMNKGG
jgi:hypothetical protein